MLFYHKRELKQNVEALIHQSWEITLQPSDSSCTLTPTHNSPLRLQSKP